MKRIKYIISFSIIFIGILIIGESHIFYLDNFYTQYDNTTLYLQINTTDEEMKRDIINSSKANNVDIFTLKRSQPSISLINYNIYGTSKVEDYINEKSNIFEGNYNSVFLGNISFEFNDFDTLEDMENQIDYYIIGSKDNIYKFKMDLIDKYAGNHPKNGYKDKESVRNTISIWILIISIILLMTIYDLISKKKENVLRITMGERIIRIFLENILLDSLFFILTYIGLLIILSKHTNVFFNFKISNIFFLILLFTNSLLYLNIYKYDVKEAFSNNQSSKNLLSFNYLFKLITSVITISIISSNIAFISQAYNFYKQKNFFENYSDYYYVKFTYKPTIKDDGSIYDVFEDSEMVQSEFYSKYFEEFNAISLKYSNYSDIEYIYANRHSFDYLSREIKELNNINLNKDYYIILPEDIKDESETISEISNIIKFEESLNFEYEVIYYKNNINLVGIDEDSKYGSNLIENPIILCNNMEVDKIKNISKKNYLGKGDFLYDVMYKISSAEELEKYNEFIKINNLEGHIIKKINVLEKYENNLLLNKRILYINSIFSFLFLVLEFIIINAIIKLEYRVNAIELSLKKIMGYSIFEKNKKIISMTIITTFLSVIISVIVSIIFETNQFYYLALGGISILFFELVTIIFYITNIESSNIQKILKGENQ